MWIKKYKRMKATPWLISHTNEHHQLNLNQSFNWMREKDDENDDWFPHELRARKLNWNWW